MTATGPPTVPHPVLTKYYRSADERRPFVTALFDATARRLSARNAQVELLMRYYWHTINECVSPDTVLDVLTSTGFVGVERRLRGGLLSEYIGLKPAR